MLKRKFVNILKSDSDKILTRFFSVKALSQNIGWVYNVRRDGFFVTNIERDGFKKGAVND